MDPEDFQHISPIQFYGKRFKTLNSAAEDIAQSEHHNIDIVIVPPNADYQTDNEDMDDDNLQPQTLPKDVPGEVEIHYSSDDGDEDNLTNNIDVDEDLSLSVLQQRWILEESKNLKNEPLWTENKLSISMEATNGYRDRLNILVDQLQHETPAQIFERLLDKDVIEHIVEQTNLYAAQNNNHQFYVSKDDIKIFIGILLLSGYNRLPRERLYWCLDDDLLVPPVVNSMSRNRFQEIKKYLHLADNSKIDKNDKMFKIRPLMDMLNTNFQQWGMFHENLSIDEAMVKYFGHHSAKQFIRGKPVRFGYKDWMLCSSTGYCYSFDTYCGAVPNASTDKKTVMLPLGSRVVLKLLDVVAKPSDHAIFFDNYFTSYDLMKTLKEKGFRATGTARDNRIKKCPLQSSNEMKKKNRGYFEYRYDRSNLLLFVKWKDNNVVTMASNYDNIEPLSKVKRWCSNTKQKVDVPQPKLFSAYNASMGGVDLCDQAVNNYRVSIQGKKWWWPLFTHMINLALVNSWRLYLAAGNTNLDLLGFQRDITRHYLNSRKKSVYSQKRTGSVPTSTLRDVGGHFPKKLEQQLRCRVCHLRARWACEKCDVTLCLERECFKQFHRAVTN